jgi:hypothetical protein
MLEKIKPKVIHAFRAQCKITHCKISGLSEQGKQESFGIKSDQTGKVPPPSKLSKHNDY